MFATRFRPATVALALLFSGAAPCYAQYDNSHCDECWTEYDYRWFEPLDLDLDCTIPRKCCGVTFRYDRVTWIMTGQRTTIGKGGLTVLSEEIRQQNPMDEGTVPPQYVIENGIQDAPPFAHFAGGDRYEFGYFNGNNSWTVGILDGPDVSTYRKYGFDELDVPGRLPLNTRQDLRRDENPLTDPNFEPAFETTLTFPVNTIPFFSEIGSADVPLSRSGFGSIHINFETPPGFLLGWRDYNGLGTPTIQGPGYVLTAAEITDDGELILLDDITLNLGNDGVIDNIDGDDIQGIVVIVDDDGDPIAVIADFDDLHEFNVRYERLDVRNVTQLDGVELMWTHEFSNRHKMAKHQNNHFSIGCGARFLRLRDRFSWDARGDWPGRTFVDTKIDNQLVGPQVRLRWNHQRGRWGFNADGRFVAGYNITDFGQEGAFGESIAPGSLNSPLMAQPTYFAHGKQEQHFSPLGELRLESTYQWTAAIALKAGYTATFIDNVTRGSQVVYYRLPDMGFLEGGQNDIFINGFDLGVEIVY